MYDVPLSKAPISTAAPSMRRARRWSLVSPAGTSELSPASMAGLPGSRAMVWVGPPLYASTPRLGATPTMLPSMPLRRPPELAASPIRLWLPETAPSTSPPEASSATMVLARVTLPPMLSMPPPRSAALPATVQSVSVSVPEL